MKAMFATGVIVSLAKGIIDDPCLVKSISKYTMIISILLGYETPINSGPPSVISRVAKFAESEEPKIDLRSSKTRDSPRKVRSLADRQSRNDGSADLPNDVSHGKL